MIMNDLIPDLLIIMFNYVPFQKMVSCRRINKRFEHTFAFDIASIDGEVFFRYNYKSIKNIILEQITPTMNGLIGWYIQTLNLRIKAPVWYFTAPHINVVTSKEVIHGRYKGSSTIGYITVDKNHDDGYECVKQICMEEKFSCVVWRDDDGTMMEYEIDDYNFVTDIFKHLHSDMKVLKRAVHLYEDSLKSQYAVFTISLLGYLYNIIPIKQKLEWLIDNSDQFFDAIHCGGLVCLKNRTAIFNDTNELCYLTQQLWQNCVELHSCFSLGHISRNQADADEGGRFAWIGEMCVGGDFSIYQQFMKKVKEKRNEMKQNNSSDSYDFGYAYRGVASLMAMYKRCDLLYYYPQDQVSFVESPLTMLSFAILPIKTVLCYQHFNLMNLPNIDLQHPNLDIISCLKTLWCLIWSTKFAMALCRPRFDLFAARNYIEARECLIEMFNDQSIFEEYWCLNESSNDKKRKFWQQFKDIIQGLFTIPRYYLKKETGDEDKWEVNEHFENEYNFHDIYLDELCDTIEDFERYYSNLEQVLPGNNVFDKPFIDDIIIEKFKKHQDVLNVQDMEAFELPKITTSPKNFLRKLFDMYPQNP